MSTIMVANYGSKQCLSLGLRRDITAGVLVVEVNGILR
jgi:hypothetical protein